MTLNFNDAGVSIVCLGGAQLPYGADAFADMIHAAARQDHPRTELIVVDDRPEPPASALPADLRGCDHVRVVGGTFKNRAARYAAGLKAATGKYLLLLDNAQVPVVLRRSAVTTLLMSAERHPGFGLIYADYERIEPDGAKRDVHLLDWHEGRLRDALDLGRAFLFETATVKAARGFNERYEAADLYDLRLRVTERGPAVHIANRYAGTLYSVAAPAGTHNVFDYLMANRDAQVEAEHALGEHLKRIGAYLAPGAHVRPVTSVTRNGSDVIASIVIPVNNRPQFIGRAIESVQAQTLREVEVIVVVNGGDADPTIPEVKRYLAGGDKHDPAAPAVRLMVVDVNNLGLCLNSGIAAAHGRYYVQLDSDDRLKPDAVEKLLAVFKSDPTVGMVIGSYEVWNLAEKSGELIRDHNVPVVTHDEWTADNGRNNLLRIGGAGAPRCAHIGVIAECGWFGVNDTSACRNYGEDYDLVLRISERYTIGRVWEPIYEVIRHSGGTDHSIDQVTIDRNDNAKDCMRLEALHRRRTLNSSNGQVKHPATKPVLASA
ncbi:MAG TPA: glycosyltransferase [Phycisphaerae bacterium]|nr:glycosyltransferase [Phycisphaerae bacterium]